MEISEGIKVLIKQWYSLASGSSAAEGALDNGYFRFMALWVSFNALYNSRQWAANESDKKQVELFSERDKNARTRHQELMRDAAEYREAVFYLKEHQEKCRCKLRDEHDLKAVLGCVYRVRNNLFHARKVFGDLLDEELVHASHKIVSELMLIEPYLNDK